ncbi:AMSH-like ubiquitin thioesterase 3 isoform X2 [Beta vulgaris subsp. vulgaris]|uniref:AMSH-like ubiquitin thioesterase 3 isoform X2 n=1 Tax=Beta vulgaris subsp. vulgaris TaxID=3555 RepID=UPI0020371D9C|nr:AMSH-like ubiquitin thioesterase 3 isoform X2 [Beta vulgaris subsp. vulgaris]
MIRLPSTPAKRIDVNTLARKIDVDNRISLGYYYRIAETLLKQADVYRKEKNIVDLYVMLIRFSSLVSETIPFHRDYQALHPRERMHYRKKLLAVMDELESLKPEFQRQVDEFNKDCIGMQQNQFNGRETTSYNSEASLGWPSAYAPRLESKQVKPASETLPYSWKQNNDFQAASTSMPFEKKFSKLSLAVPLPNQETLSRHSFLGPNGLRRQWQGPTTEIKVSYPSRADLTPAKDSCLTQSIQNAARVQKDEGIGQDMQAVLSLDDGGWSRCEEDMPVGIIRQPLPPPVLAQVQPALHPIPPSRVADPRPGPAKPSEDGTQSPNSFQDLHIPVKMMEDFLRLAQQNTKKNLETCGVLAGSLCQTLNEEEIFEVQDRESLFPLGWIHTHPTQTCFMSSVDLHTHYSYQIMLPESIAIVMAPTDSSSPHGIFHLSDPGGVSVIRNCQQRGFHPHEEPSDGSPLYEHCSHVYMNPKLRFDVVDLR